MSGSPEADTEADARRRAEADVPDAWLVCHRLARDEGLAAGLTELSRTLGPGVLPCGPGGHALVPADLARTARRVWYDGVLSDRAAGRDTALTPALVSDEGLVALRHSQGWLVASRGAKDPLLATLASARPRSSLALAAVAPAQWRIGLAWLRLGLSERLAGSCLSYLGGREVDGGTLLGQQLVQAGLADALIAHAEVRAMLAPRSPASASKAAIGWLHGRLTLADRDLIRLLGGSGFVSEPGRCAMVSELLADVYLGHGDRHAARDRHTAGDRHAAGGGSHDRA